MKRTAVILKGAVDKVIPTTPNQLSRLLAAFKDARVKGIRSGKEMRRHYQIFTELECERFNNEDDLAKDFIILGRFETKGDGNGKSYNSTITRKITGNEY